MKLLLTSTLLVAALCAPALAEAPRPAKSVRATFVVTSAKQRPRQYQVATVDHTCGVVNTKDSDTKIEDELRMCPMADDQVQIQWLTREGSAEYRSTAALIVKPGTRLDVDGNGAKLAVTFQ